MRLILPKLLWLLTIALIGASWVPGLVRPVDFSGLDLNMASQIGFHWSFLVAPADLLAAGKALFDPVAVHYGCWLPILIGGWGLHFQPLSMGQLVQVIRFLNVVFLCLFLYVYFKYSRGKIVPVAIAVIMSLPFFCYNCTGIYTVNLSAWRFLGIPIAFVALILVRKLDYFMQFLVLGFMAGFLALYNIETGIILCCGFILYCFLIWINAPSLGSVLRNSVLFFIGFALSILVFVSICSIWLQQPINWAKFLIVFSYIRTIMKTGYTGLKMTFSPVATLILIHCVFVILKSSLIEKFYFWQRYRLIVAAVLLIWLAYWFNRPQQLNLAMMYPLYGVLVIDLVRKFQYASKVGFANVALCIGMILSVLIFSECRRNFQDAWPAYISFLKAQNYEDKKLLSGVYFSKTVGEFLFKRCEFISQLEDPEPLFLSPYQYYITKITGKHPNISFADPFELAITKTDVDKLLKQILGSAKSQIYIDSSTRISKLPSGQPAGSFACPAYYAALRILLSKSYTFDHINQNGWEIWRKRLVISHEAYN